MKLELKNVSAGYGKVAVLEKVSLTREGGITVLLGRNGAGKSTLLGCLTGRKSYEGSIRLDGREVSSLSPGARARLVAALPQQLPAPRVTVRELVGFGRAPYLPLTGRLSEEDRRAVEAALEAVGMDAFAEQTVDTLSGGQQKKAFLAMVLAQDAPLVVLDEPTAHLDAASRFELLELLRRLCRETGKTFLVVLHELPEALLLADRIAVLAEHSLVFCGTPGECLERKIPQTWFDIQITGTPETGYAVSPK